MAPPKFCLSAATGTMTTAATAITIKPPMQAARLPAREEAPPRRGVAEFGFQEGDAEAEAAEDQRRRGRLAVEQHQCEQDRGGRQRETKEQAGRCRRRRAHRAHSTLRWTWELLRMALPANQEPRPSFFFRSSHLVRADWSGREASVVHSTIEPA